MTTSGKKHLSSTKATILGLFLFFVIIFIIGLVQTAGNKYENIIRQTEITPPQSQTTITIQTPAPSTVAKTPANK